jgi:hypothetical protein
LEFVSDDKEPFGGALFVWEGAERESGILNYEFWILN